MPKPTVTSGSNVTTSTSASTPDPEVVEDVLPEVEVESKADSELDAETFIEDTSTAQGNRYPETLGSLESTLRVAESEVAILTKELDRAKARVKDAKAAVKAYKG